MGGLSKTATSIVITAIFASLLLVMSFNESAVEQCDSVYKNDPENVPESVSNNISESSDSESVHTEEQNDPGIGPKGVQAHLSYWEKQKKQSYEERCKKYNLDMSDYSIYNNWSEISVKGDSWEEAYIDLIDEFVGYTVTDFLYDYPNDDGSFSDEFYFSLLYLNDDETPEIEISFSDPLEGISKYYSFDGEKTVYCDLPLETNKFGSSYMFKGFIFSFYRTDMLNHWYTFYNINDDLNCEEGVTLREYTPWGEDELIKHEDGMHYSFSTGPDSEEKEISEKEFLSYFEKMGVDPEDPDKSTAPEPECLFSGKFDKMIEYLKNRVESISMETDPAEE